MDYREKIKEVYRLSDFCVDDAIYKYYLVSNYTEPQRHLLIVNNGNEITVVTKEENSHLLTVLDVNKENWRLINIKCGKPFYCVGFLEGISGAFAQKGIDITITSTYENDFIFVQEKFFNEAIEIMKVLGIAWVGAE